MADKKGNFEAEEFFGTPLTSAMAMPFNLAVGDIIHGRISKIDDEYVYVSTGFKSEGRIPLKEFDPDADGDIGYKEDEEVEVMVKRIADEDIYLSYAEVTEIRRWDDLEKAYEDGEAIEGTVEKSVKGGYRMNVGVSRHAFMPGSHLGYQVKDQEQIVGQKLVVKIIELDLDKENIVVSHRQIRQQELAEKEDEVFGSIQEGVIIPGTVTRLAKFGAFVDIGGVEGLVHVSELAWSRVAHPSNVLKEGEEVQVKVLNVNREEKKISLSIKAATPDPWETAEEQFKIDSVIQAKVSKVVKFGLFVRLDENFEGLLHISEIQDSMGGDRAKFSPNQDIKVRILGVDSQNRRIKLGLAEPVAASVPSNIKQYIDDGKSSVTLGDMLDLDE